MSLFIKEYPLMIAFFMLERSVIVIRCSFAFYFFLFLLLLFYVFFAVVAVVAATATLRVNFKFSTLSLRCQIDNIFGVHAESTLIDLFRAQNVSLEIKSLTVYAMQRFRRWQQRLNRKDIISFYNKRQSI